LMGDTFTDKIEVLMGALGDMISRPLLPRRQLPLSVGSCPADKEIQKENIMARSHKRLLGSALALVAGLAAASLMFLGAGSVPAPVRAEAVVPPALHISHLSSLNPTSPTTPVRLIFIHHSTGGNWLADDNGGLGIALMNNNYYVSDTNYGWGPYDFDVDNGERIGDHTDISDWPHWFTGPHRDTYLAALYAESGQHPSGYYSRLASNPGGENQIIMFKSCFPNSDLDGSPNDPPTQWWTDLNVGSAKYVYNDLLQYFATRQDKLFVVITAPPLRSGGTTPEHAANARAFNDWLVNHWLEDYPYNNVAVFDFYNVLTSNGGDWDTNDLNSAGGNHHRWWNGAIQHVHPVDYNYAAYPSDGGDSHPSWAGNLKATGEFLPLLNIYYHLWQEGGGAEGASQKTASARIAQYGDVITYTVVVRDLSAPLTATVYLTDALPSGVAYVPGTLSATAGTPNETPPTLTWTGTLSPATVVTITYAATISASAPRVITNSAVIAAPGYETITRIATLWANWRSSYLPLVMKH
jgi:uncharacterized repeat protein (TIGR01451 family)